MKTRQSMVLIWGAALMLILNGMIWQKEAVRTSGRRVLLDLRPRDPRSLMQGDYMVLRYRLAEEVPRSALKTREPTGVLVARLDAQEIAHYARFDDGRALAPEEVRLRYAPSENRRGGLRVAPESYFFQEGKAKEFQAARYAELRVTEEGESLIVGLLDGDRRPLGKKSD